MTVKTFHIFKPGTHRSMAGESIPFTPADLQGAALAFSESVRSAPLVLGHPQHDSPAMGWVKSLSYDSGGLYATADFGEELVSHVKAKRYPNVSAKFIRKDDARNPKPGQWYLQHVGFLGAQAPAVKHLEPVTFAEFSWDGAVITEPRALDVAFSEPNATGWESDENKQREVHLALAKLLMQRSPGMDFAGAAHQAHIDLEGFKARRAKDSGMDPDRVAFHEAALDYQAKVPGTSYAAAAYKVFSVR